MLPAMNLIEKLKRGVQLFWTGVFCYSTMSLLALGTLNLYSECDKPLAVVLIDQSPEINPPPITADLDLLTDPQFELFVEDPEFVAWIAEAEPENQSAENSG